MDFLRDRDARWGHPACRRAPYYGVGIRDHPIAPRSPWQNGYAERLIGSIRRECLDSVVALSEAHLPRILVAYADNYHKLRIHRTLGKGTPLLRAVESLGAVASRPILGGLHH